MNKYRKVLTHHFQSTLVLGKDGSVTGISQRQNTWFLWGVVLSILINLLAEKKYNYHLQWCGSEKLTKSSRIHFLNFDLFAKTFCYKFSLLLAQYNLSWSPHVTPIKICRIYPICSFLLVPPLHVMLKVLRYVSINSVGFFCFILVFVFFFQIPKKNILWPQKANMELTRNSLNSPRWHHQRHHQGKVWCRIWFFAIYHFKNLLLVKSSSTKS